MRSSLTLRCASQQAKQFISVLRTVIESAPSTGLEFSNLEAGVVALTGSDATYSAHGFRSLLHALAEINDVHFIHSDSTVIPCMWDKVVSGIRSKIPAEGLSEEDFVMLIQKEVPLFNQDAFPGVGIARWAAARFPNLICVSRSAVTMTPIFRPCAYVATGTAASIAYGLAQLGRQELPVWTDFSKLAPLLPSAISPSEGAWAQFLSQSDVTEMFDVQAEAMISLAPRYSEMVVLVDGTSLTVADAQRILQRDSFEKRRMVTVYRRSTCQPHSDTDELIGTFLDADHMIHAAAARLVSQNNRQQKLIAVLCGEDSKEKILSAMRDLARSDVHISVHTPLTSVEVCDVSSV